MTSVTFSAIGKRVRVEGCFTFVCTFLPANDARPSYLCLPDCYLLGGCAKASKDSDQAIRRTALS